MTPDLDREEAIRVRAMCEGCLPEWQNQWIYDRIVWASPEDTYGKAELECQRCSRVTTWRLGGAALPGEVVPGELPCLDGCGGRIEPGGETGAVMVCDTCGWRGGQ